MYRQSFRPLAYSFSKAIESTEAVRMVMDGLQIVALKYFGLRLRPTVSISDHSEGLRTGMAHILTSRPLGEVPEETELPLPHLGDWAHTLQKISHVTRGDSAFHKGNVAAERSRTVDLRLEPRLAISRLHGLLAISRLHDFTFHNTPCLVTRDHVLFTRA